MLVDGRGADIQESDTELEADLRASIAQRCLNDRSTGELASHVSEAVLVWIRNTHVEYWPGRKLGSLPVCEKLLVVLLADPRTEVISFEVDIGTAGSLLVRIGSVHVLDHPESQWEVRFQSSGDAMLCLNFDESLRPDEREIETIGKGLAFPDLSRHAQTLRIFLEIMRREVLASYDGSAPRCPRLSADKHVKH